jgi:polar amino acid transport system substrate-binding protein
MPLVCCYLSILFQVELSFAQSKFELPRFRHTAPVNGSIAVTRKETAVLLADEDFPPFSFRSSSGALAGLSVDMALAACAEVKLTCEVAARPYEELMAALAKGEGEAVITGPNLDKGLPDGVTTTRPYFRTLGRFAVRKGSPIENGDMRTLAGKRVGAVKGTSHIAWLERYYPRSTIVPFDSEREVQEALRTGTIDAMFGDAFRLIFWLSGSSSRACCQLAGGAYVDHAYFTRNLEFIVKRDSEDLRAALDLGLDRLQDRGFTNEIFGRYLPLNPW